MNASAILSPLAASLACAGVLASIGAAGVLAGEPWLIASLGASALLQLLAPRLPAARAWNTAAGQLVGFAAGFAAVYALGATAAPHVATTEPMTWIRVAAAALAIAITALGQRLIKATNPAGGSTALLIALGKIRPTAHGAWLVVVGILLVTLIGEAARFALLWVESE
jgi:CBS domain-containing membrane protein